VIQLLIFEFLGGIAVGVLAVIAYLNH